MSEQVKKTYEYPVVWYNTTEALEKAFGKEFLALREKHIALGREQALVNAEMTKLAAATVEAQRDIPTSLAVKLVRNYQTGSIGVTLAKPKEAKKPKADKPSGFEAFGTAKLYTKADGKIAAKPSVVPTARPGKAA